MLVLSDTEKRAESLKIARNSMGNNPMVGATVAVAVAVQQAQK